MKEIIVNGRQIKLATNCLGAHINDEIYDNNEKVIGKVINTGQSGNYDILYVAFPSCPKGRHINPMDDAQIQRRYQKVIAEKPKQEKCYIVRVGEAWNYIGYHWTSTVFTDSKEAKDYFDKMKEEKIQQIIDDNEMSEEEAKKYREEIAENITYNYYDNPDYCEDPDGEWAVSYEISETIEKYEEKEE